MVLVTVNAQVASLKAKYEYLPSWVRLVHTTWNLKNMWANSGPKAGTWENGKTWPNNPACELRLVKTLGKWWPHGQSVGKRSKRVETGCATVEIGQTLGKMVVARTKRGKTAKTGARLSQGRDSAKTAFAGPKRGKTVVARPNRWKTVAERPKRAKTVAERPKRAKTVAERPKRGKTAKRSPGNPVTYVTVEFGRSAGKTVVARPRRRENGSRTAENGQNGGNGET
jgi:hypothetical protein